MSTGTRHMTVHDCLILVAALFSICGIVGFLIGIIANLIHIFSDGNGIEWKSIDVDLKLEKLTNTDVRIPYGAKLKALEAKESRIFDDLAIAYPSVTLENKRIKFKIDPAILGMTSDGRMFMVCYWDIGKDIEKSWQKIRYLKKFKIVKE